MDQWYFERQGKRFGPCSQEKLQQLLAAGQIGADNLVWRNGMPSWVPARTLPELSAAPAPAAAAKSPAPPTPAVAAKSPAPPTPAPATKTPAPIQPTAPAPMSPAAPVESASEPVAAATRSTRPRGSGGLLGLLHRLLPKPLLFGLYGALGALLGLLLLGELLYWLVRPPELKPEVKLAVAEQLIAYPGGENTLAVKIARSGFRGHVTVGVPDAPRGIQISTVSLADGETDALLTVRVTPNSETRVHYLKVEAAADNAEPASVGFNLKVQEPPPRLLAAVSPAVTVYAGDKNRFQVLLSRDRFKGPVRVEVLDLPPGIVIPLVTVAEGKPEAVLDVIAAKNAAVKEYRLPIEAHALSDHTIRVTDTLWLNVEPPPGKLQLAVAPRVTVFPADKNRFTVRVARQDFKAPVHVEVEGLPAGVRIAGAVIPAEKAEVELEVIADGTALLGTHSARLRAKAETAEKIIASLPLQLVVAAPPPTLQLAVAPKVSVYPGGKTRFGVRIARERFNAPVRIELRDPSRLLTAAPIIIPGGATEGEIELTATPATLRGPLPRQLTPAVIASDTTGKASSPAEAVPVQVLAPPSDLELTVSPTVEAYQGGKFRFAVKVARAGFIGPVQLHFEGLPEGIALPVGVYAPKGAATLNLPANLKDLPLEGRAALRTAPGKYNVKLTGIGPKAPDGKTPTKETTFTLEVKTLPPSKRPPPIDVVFVLDVTNSMDPQIKGIRDGIGKFLKEMKNNELDARVGMVAFRDILYFDADPMTILKFKGGDLFTRDAAAFSTEVGKLKAVGGGDLPESSMEALTTAAKHPFRSGALRVLLLITDERPQTRGNSMPLASALKLLKDRKIDQIHLIVNPAHRPIYEKLHAVAKGGYFDLQKASKVGPGSEGFTSLLPVLSQGIADTIEAAGPAAPRAADPPTPPPPPPPPAGLASEKPPPPRAATPPAPPKVPVPPPPVAGIAAAPRVAAPQPPTTASPTPPRADESGLQGLQSTLVIPQEYRLQLLGAIALWSAALAAGIGLALVAGQRLYLQRGLPRFGASFKALLAGGIAGLIGGAAGQWFFQSTAAPADSTVLALVWEATSRVLAWGLLGGLLGLGMSVFVPNLRRLGGFLGGAAGGLLGALGFVALSALSGPAPARWAGAALLGFCIGMMIALAEKVFRRYWLEVRFGEREIRTYTLGPVPLAVGADEASATVCVRDAPPRALGYYVRGGRVVCEDYTLGTTADAPPGDTRPLGNAKLTVRSDVNAKPTGMNLRLMQVRSVSLLEGMPLTADDLAGLEPQGSDGVVALVSRRPGDPNALLLRNRSKQPWVVKDAAGERTVEPGLSVELSGRCEINFGQVQGKLDISAG